MRTVILFVAASVLLLAGRDACAESRVALVIGNSNYAHGAALANPVNDATAVSLMLAEAGFQVDVRSNLADKEMRLAFRDFSIKTRDADIVVVYFAGHGIEVGGENWLIPTDAVLNRDIDVQDETISLKRVMELIEPARRLRLVILDACRDNPFTGTMSRARPTRGPINCGLARVDENMITTDTLIAFAAKAGSTASDSVGAHSPFTQALLTRLPTPGLDVGLAFRLVRDDVLASTDSKQEPFLYGSLGGGMVALVPGEQGQPAAYTPAAKPGGEAWRDYEYAKKNGTKEVWQLFLAQHPSGFYAGLAKAELDRLLSPAPAVAPPSTAMTGPQSLPPPTAPSLAAVDPVAPVTLPKPAAPESKPAVPAAATPSAPTAPVRKFKPEPEAPAKKTATRKSDDDDDKPRARGGNTTRERPARSNSEDRPRRTGGTACAYGRAGVRWGRAYGLDNGNGVIAAVAAHCGS